MGDGAGVGLGEGLGVETGVGDGVGMGVGAGSVVGSGREVGIGAGTEVLVGAGVGETGAVVGVGAGACAINKSSIASEMVSKDGEPSNLTPVALGSLLSTKMVGVTETSLRRARFISL